MLEMSFTRARHEFEELLEERGLAVAAETSVFVHERQAQEYAQWLAAKTYEMVTDQLGIDREGFAVVYDEPDEEAAEPEAEVEGEAADTGL